MRLLTVFLNVVFVVLVFWANDVDSRRGPGDDAVDPTDEPSVDVTFVVSQVEEELTSMQEDIQQSKRKFRQFVEVFKNSGQDRTQVIALNLTLHTLRAQTRRLHDEVSRSIANMNDFYRCLFNCYMTHKTTDTGEPVPEANVHYFCNHNCMLAFEMNGHNTDVTSAATDVIDGAMTTGPSVESVPVGK